MRNKVLIYCDYGCSDITNLQETVGAYFSPKNIKVGLVDANDIIKNDVLNKDVLAFILPGGASTPFRMKLRTLGDNKIKEYIRRGGTYLGICAGAYYACDFIEFEKDVPELRICTDESLKIINADAVGTLHKELGILPYSRTANSAAVVRLKSVKNNDEYISYYHGGPYFNVKGTNIDVLAVYEDIKGKPPAIISSSYGEGRVIASGVHFEDSGVQLQKAVHHLRVDAKSAKENADKLIKNEQLRMSLVNKLMGLMK